MRGGGGGQDPGGRCEGVITAVGGAKAEEAPPLWGLTVPHLVGWGVLNLGVSKDSSICHLGPCELDTPRLEGSGTQGQATPTGITEARGQPH